MTPTEQLTLEDIIQLPLPGLNIPGSLQFSPDGQLITYLFSEDASLTRQLFAFDLETGKSRRLISPPDGGTTDENISLEETLRRERTRQKEFGITRYSWSGKGNRLLIPIRGDIYMQEGADGELRQIVSGNNYPCLDPRFSADGEWIAYIQDAELMIVSAAGGEPSQVTAGARGTGRTNGLAEYIAQEEMGRRRGYWWSPDSQWLAFVEVDETHIPIYRIVHQGKDQVGDAAQEDHRYPFTGGANARVRLGIVSREGRELTWMDLGDDEDIYLARVKWLPNGRLTAQILNRPQTQLDLVSFNPQTGEPTLLVRETSDVWINLHNLYHPLKDGRFLWASERSGFRHLYLYNEEGQLIRQLTSGDWRVDEIAGLDARQGILYFTASLPTPTESHLYALSLEGGDLRPLTSKPGMHTIVADVKNGRFLDITSSLNNPPVITMRSLEDGTVLRDIFTEVDPRVRKFDLTPPEIVALTSRRGVQLFGAIYRPPASYGAGSFPTIVSVYGGPHAQRVTNSWGLTADMRAQYLAQKGFLVFKLDNQGSSRRGLAFEGIIKHNMGDVEVQDQVDGVKWLVEKGLADPDRIGIYGSSYGGYMVCMCLMRAADTFKTAVASAPVTHWDGYDTCYTERYMGTPQTNPEGYQISSVLYHAQNLKGNLLLIHGLIDENVHFRHTARLINALNRARKPYDLLLLPDERHSPRKPADRLYLEERIINYFLDNL